MWRRGGGSGIGALSFIIIKKMIFKKHLLQNSFLMNLED